VCAGLTTKVVTVDASENDECLRDVAADGSGEATTTASRIAAFSRQAGDLLGVHPGVASHEHLRRFRET